MCRGRPGMGSKEPHVVRLSHMAIHAADVGTIHGVVKKEEECANCSGGMKDCNGCHGTGVITCSTCEGIGKTEIMNNCVAHDQWNSHYYCSIHGKDVGRYH